MRATPGVYAIERSSRVLTGTFDCISILPPRCIRNVRSETCSTSTPSTSADALDDPLEVLGVGGVDRDVAHLDALLDANEVDRAE